MAQRHSPRVGARTLTRLARRHVVRVGIRVSRVARSRGALVCAVGVGCLWWAAIGRLCYEQVRKYRAASEFQTSPGERTLPSRETRDGNRPHPSPSLTVRDATDDDTSSLAEQLLSHARDLFDAGDFRGAARAYRNVLAVSPHDRQAHDGLSISLHHDKRFGPIRSAFDGQDFRTALHLLYQLEPDPLDSELVATYKANCWTNLALVALRARRCDEADQCLSEALQLKADDAELLWLLAEVEYCRSDPRYARYAATIDQHEFHQLAD